MPVIHVQHIALLTFTQYRRCWNPWRLLKQRVITKNFQIVLETYRIIRLLEGK
jgi:hypothetical protein